LCSGGGEKKIIVNYELVAVEWPKNRTKIEKKKNSNNNKDKKKSGGNKLQMYY